MPVAFAGTRGKSDGEGASRQRHRVKINLPLRLYDPIVAAVLGLALGGFGFGYVPCLSMDRPDGPCWTAGALGAASAFADLKVWVSSPDLDMALWVAAATTLVLFVVVAARLIVAYVRTV